jgi:outer membrane protein OmpA-like peptidoglycan-associated protein
MVEIPVQRKTGFPGWALALMSLVILGVAILLFALLGRERGRAAHDAGAAAPGSVVAAPGAARDMTPSGRATCHRDEDCAERQLCLADVCTSIKPGVAECAMTRVHFATDSAELEAAEEPALVRMARCLKVDQAMKLTIAGGADERGTAAHNEELGERRAMAVSRYLQAHGVSADQLKIVSYGENRPLCLESDRECWAKNRRAALKPQ